jgi:PDZ domain
MALPGPTPPHLSRETRLLLVTIMISMAALWALARLRFPNRPATPNPVAPLLTQLAVPVGFDDLASEVSKIESRLLPSLVPVELTGAFVAALRVRDDIGATLLASGGQSAKLEADSPTLLAHDPVSGLALVRVPGAPAPELTPWAPPRLDTPRYLLASDFSQRGASLRPVFIGRLYPVMNPAWPGETWVLPARTNVAPGDLLFTVDGALAGLVIADSGTLVLVPGETVLSAADRLRGQKPASAGWLGIDVQALTPPLATATGARAGVIVSSVNRDGPAAGKLVVTDVIEAAGGESIGSPRDWRARAVRLKPGESIVLRVRRRGSAVDVPLTVAAPPKTGNPLTLGLTMRSLPQLGAEVVQVGDGSAGARAGILRGDVIVTIGEIQTPTASQVTQAFAAASTERPLLAAVMRADVHYVVAIEKR